MASIRSTEGPSGKKTQSKEGKLGVLAAGTEYISAGATLGHRMPALALEI